MNPIVEKQLFRRKNFLIKHLIWQKRQNMVLNANLVHKSFDKNSFGAIKCEATPKQQQ